jgi:hypothetical protein
MTPQDHNKVIGIMHLIWGGLTALIMVIVSLFFFPMMGFAAADPNTPRALPVVFGFFGVLMIVLGLVLGLPSVIAGYAMLRRKSWARVVGIIAACLEALSFPFGTALCVYTFWFLFGPGERFLAGDYSQPPDWRASLRDAGTYDWETQSARQTGRQRDYAPPPQPPDWRGQ